MNNKKYVKPFLTEVIARMDFASAIDELATKLPSSLSKKALEYFPILEPKDLVAQELSISQKGIEERYSKLMKEWNFHGKQKEKTLTITSEMMFVSHKSYETFEKFKLEFTNVAAELYSAYNELQLRRFGLRYINTLKVDGTDFTNWQEYLNDRLLSTFEIPENIELIARAFNTLILNYGDFNLTFQYGIHNKDFPAPVRSKTFILDFDAYYQGLIEANQISVYLDRFHEEIQKYFESSIKDPLRELMGTTQ